MSRAIRSHADSRRVDRELDSSASFQPDLHFHTADTEQRVLSRILAAVEVLLRDLVEGPS
jgi:hypothetical protein